MSTPFFGRLTGLEKSDAGAAGGTAATTRGVVSTETLFITNYDILRARNVAGKLSFFAKIVIADFPFARMVRKAYCFSGLSDGVTVTQRPLEALFMVRIHVGQPNNRFTLPVEFRFASTASFGIG